ncbi:dna-directed rna polymerases i ii and iii subunit rpabc2 [Holotrichia oblita]|uniref:Dna-directed rna polymerases i ii and iii subunit rpabc2 n=1 Tax=Holotrichia oblita TaxID=644536 RepID=A0ACB9SKA2_HOLOL|nr:dna-directed rna polymerases i ii and iii subunit rpabc2 [Holotrichia oblita]
MVESTFGILANRWRVLLNPINLSEEKVEVITLACIALHNFLTRETQSYIGEKCEQDIKNCTATLPQIVRQAGNNFKTLARIVREEYKNYFNSERGAVPWQDNAVQRRNW